MPTCLQERLLKFLTNNIGVYMCTLDTNSHNIGLKHAWCGFWYTGFLQLRMVKLFFDDWTGYYFARIFSMRNYITYFSFFLAFDFGFCRSYSALSHQTCPFWSNIPFITVPLSRTHGKSFATQWAEACKENCGETRKCRGDPRGWMWPGPGPPGILLLSR